MLKFIDTEAIADNDQQLLCDSEEEEEKITEELDDFIDNNSQLGESVNFYRDVDNNPSEFHNQPKNSHDAIFECDYSL